MTTQYRKQGSSLYQLRGSAYVHCANLPLNIKTMTAAVKWYEAE